MQFQAASDISRATSIGSSLLQIHHRVTLLPSNTYDSDNLRWSTAFLWVSYCLKHEDAEGEVTQHHMHKGPASALNMERLSKTSQLMSRYSLQPQPPIKLRLDIDPLDSVIGERIYLRRLWRLLNHAGRRL